MRTTAARISQLIFLALFLGLFVLTDYRGKDDIPTAINSFFRADPLVVVSYILSVKGFTYLLLPAFMMTLFTMMLGRFFCGWICPVGTVIDIITNRIKKTVPLKSLKSTLKYYLLFVLLFAAFLNINLAGILDPLAIFVRALTFFFYPLFGYTVRSGWTGLYAAIGDSRDYIEPGYRLLNDYLLPFRETMYPLALLSLIIFIAIIALERFEKRNWCKNICPLGTLLSLLSRLSPLRRMPVKLCADCGSCKTICPTAFDEDILQMNDCILCMDCRRFCQSRRIQFKWRWSGKKKRLQINGSAPFMQRRVLLGSLLSGFFLSRIFTFQAPSKNEKLLRPPGVSNEKEFLTKCIRCGECMKVCLRSALYPDLEKAGIYGIFMPILIPRLGYCEYNCNLCGQVCPTGAIPKLPLESKQKSVIGCAVIDKNHCLPYAKGMNCIVCEEHCPIPQKAIRSEIVTQKDFSGRKTILKRPYIVDELCTGCGICENKCPLDGKPAIEVFSKKRI